jgi:signal transduction histidine kinase
VREPALTTMTTLGFEIEPVSAAADARRRWAIRPGIALLTALAAALAPGVPPAVALLAAAAGVTGVLGRLAQPAWRALRRYPSLIIVALLVALAGAWVWTGLHAAASHEPSFNPFDDPIVLGYPSFGPRVAGGGWPWRLGGMSVLPLVLALLSAGAGFVLITDAVRVQLGIARPPRTAWRLITAPLPQTGRIATRAVPGVGLVIVATFLSFGLATQLAGYRPLLATWLQLVISAWATALVVGPVGIGIAMQLDRDKAGRARELERQRFAAHLHDSVLQTLALVQRQAHDPAAVVRLARRQEAALRAWMAGEAELAGNTVTAALREAIAEVEDEHELTVEVSTMGDRALDGRGEELVAAAREALRNAARHAPGAHVFVFADIDAARAELFIRDDGPGFEPETVPAERRGLRDAVVGRMAAAGGNATIDSAPGHGTEVTLRLPWNGRSR